MENDQADGFRQLEEECREMAKRASWVNEALSRPARPGVDGMERKLAHACQYVESAVEELGKVVGRVRELEAAFLEAQTTAAERDQAAAGAAAKVRDAERTMAAADLKAEDAARKTAAANVEAAAAEASMKAYDRLKRELRDEREALATRVKRAREMELQAQSLEKQRDEARRDVARFNVVRDDLVTEKDHLKRERKTLEGDLVKYNDAVAEYSKLKSQMAEEVRQEKARVGRRDETIASLKRDVQARDQSILKMESDHAAEVKQVASDMKIKEMQLRMSSEYEGLAQKIDEMQISTQQSLTNLPPSTRAVKDLEKQVEDMKKQLEKTEAAHSERRRDEAAAAEKHRGLLVQEYDSQIREEYQRQLQELRTTKEAELAGVRQQLEELRTTKEGELADTSQQYERQLEELRVVKEGELADVRQQCKTQLEELRTTKEAELTDARQQCESRLEELRTTKEGEFADVRRQLETHLDELQTAKEELTKSCQLCESREEELRTAKDELTKSSQLCESREEELRTTEGDLAKSSQLCESRLEELRTAKEELASVRQRSDDEIEAARTRADDLQLVVGQLQRELEENQRSPGPKRKKPRADDPQPRPQTPPPSAPGGEGAKGTEMTRWQAAQQSESEFWSSFEPRLFDPSENLSYEVLLYSLRKAARDEVTRSRFMAFLQSDVTGWHCVERVVDPGSESAVQAVDGKCTLKRHKKAGECLRMRRIGGRNVDFQYMKNG